MPIVEFDGPPSWSLDGRETGESTKCPWVVSVAHRHYPRAFCTLPSFARIERPRWRPVEPHGKIGDCEQSNPFQEYGGTLLNVITASGKPYPGMLGSKKERGSWEGDYKYWHFVSLRPETRVSTRVSRRKWVQSTELDIVNGSFCRAGVTYLRYTVLASPNKGETAVHCCDPALSVLVMLVSRNVFHKVSALKSVVSFSAPSVVCWQPVFSLRVTWTSV